MDPDEDDDGDCVPNLIEMVIGDSSNDGEDYTLMGVPSPAMIDNTQVQIFLHSIILQNRSNMDFDSQEFYMGFTGCLPTTSTRRIRSCGSLYS